MKVIGKRSLAFTVDKLNMWTASTEVEEFKDLVSKMFGKIIIDCSKVKYIDASGLGALLHITVGIVKKHKVIFTRVNPAVHEVIKITQLKGTIKIKDNIVLK